MPGPCLLCGSPGAQPLHRGVPRLGSTAPSRFDVEACDRCGLLRTSPSPSADELREAYGAAYTWQAARTLVARAEAGYRELLARLDQARAAKLAVKIAGGRRLLDVGCGDGLLITQARRLGIEAFGVDRAGAPLWPGCDPAWRETGDIEALEQQAGTWDVVSLFHVAEHLRAPLDLFRHVHTWLRPGGVFLIQVPNSGSLQAQLFGPRWYGFDVPRHLVHWSVATLRRALETSGFEVVRTQGISWRDNGPLWVGSVLPGLDPLIERERTLAGASRHAIVTLARRLFYLALVWAATPLWLAEAAIGRAPTLTVFARKV